MGGKANLFLVAGFTIIFLVLGHHFGRLSTDSVDNLSDYYEETKAHNLAVSAANMAANEVFFNQNWNAGFQNVSFDGGTIDVQVALEDAIQDIRSITAQGTYQGITKTVKVYLQPSKFSKFAYYSRYEPPNIWWMAKDTVWGPFHTQGYLRAARHPVFYGKVTIKKKIIYYQSKRKDKPRFYGGFEKGVDLPLPTDGVDKLELAADAGGYKFTGQDTVFLKFMGDSIVAKYHYLDDWDGDILKDFIESGNNGVIFAKDAILRIQGTVKGQYSVGASGTADGNGRIYLDDDIVYNDDPRTNPNSSDLLGIIAKRDVYITDNNLNRDDINIHASIYCETGGFGSQNYSTRPASGYINLLGGIIQDTRRAVGTFSGTTISHGFAKRYRYDDRLMYTSPPHYPGTGAFEIVSWLE